jgi:hypothetical protein
MEKEEGMCDTLTGGATGQVEFVANKDFRSDVEVNARKTTLRRAEALPPGA